MKNKPIQFGNPFNEKQMGQSKTNESLKIRFLLSKGLGVFQSFWRPVRYFLNCLVSSKCYRVHRVSSSLLSPVDPRFEPSLDASSLRSDVISSMKISSCKSTDVCTSIIQHSSQPPETKHRLTNSFELWFRGCGFSFRV